MKHLLLAALVCLPVLALAQEKPAPSGVVVFKLGEQFATDAKAGETIDSLCAWLGRNVAGAAFERRGVRNKPDDALKLLRDDAKPAALAIVSPGLYFKHGKDLKLTVLAESRRGDNDGEQYVLVGLDAAEKYPQGATVATTMTADSDWLNKAVLPAPEGAKAVSWVQYDNLFDAGYAIADGEKSAPRYVLVDRITLKAMQADADLKALKQGLKSELLPQDLVVEVAGRLGETRDTLKKALKELNESEDGRKLGKSLQTANFPAADAARIARVAKLYE